MNRRFIAHILLLNRILIHGDIHYDIHSTKNLKSDAKIEPNMEFILLLCNNIIILIRLFSISSIYWLFLEIEKHQENFNSGTRDLTQQNFALFGCLMRGRTKKLTKPIARNPYLKLCSLY